MIISLFTKLLDALRLEPREQRGNIAWPQETGSSLPAIIYRPDLIRPCYEYGPEKIIDSESFLALVDCLRERLSESSYDFRYAYFGLIAVLQQKSIFRFWDGRKEAIDELVFSGIIFNTNGYEYAARITLNEFFDYIYTYDPEKDPYIAVKRQRYMEEYLAEYTWHRV